MRSVDCATSTGVTRSSVGSNARWTLISVHAAVRGADVT
jgi:hypothetical protein